MEQKGNYLVLTRRKCEERNSRGHYAEHEEINCPFAELWSFSESLQSC